MFEILADLALSDTGLFIIAVLFLAVLALQIKRRQGRILRNEGNPSYEQLSLSIKLRGAENQLNAACASQKRLERLFEKLSDTIKVIARAPRAEVVGEAIVDLLQDLLQVEEAALFVRDKESNRLTLFKNRGLDKDLDGRFSIGMGEGFIGWVAGQDGIRNLEDHRFLSDGLGPQSSELLMYQCGAKHLHSSIAVPIRYADRVIGVINLGVLGAEAEYAKGVLELVADLAAAGLHAALASKRRPRAQEEPPDGSEHGGDGLQRRLRAVK